MHPTTEPCGNAETWARVMDVSKTVDFDEQQRLVDSPALRRRETALQTRAALLRGSQSASMAGSMMTSLSFGASIGSSIAAASQALSEFHQSPSRCSALAALEACQFRTFCCSFSALERTRDLP